MKTHFKLPEVVIEVEGIPVDAGAGRALEEVRIAQRLSLPTQCELIFRDPPGPLDLARQLTPGKKLRLALRDQRQPLFVGEVTALEYRYSPSNEREIRVRGYDLLHRLRKRQSVCAHVQETLPNLAHELTADLGLTIQAAETFAVEWKRIIQHRQSDLELLVEAAARCGAYLTLRENELHLLTLEGTGAPLNLRLGDTLYEARFDLNGDPACRAVKVDGWDPLVVETHSANATQARSGRRVSAEAAPDLFSEEGQRNLADELATDDRQAMALAQAELDQRLAREVILWGVAEGDPALMPGAVVEIEGVEDALEGRYVLTTVTHQINARLGFISELSSEPPAPTPRSRSSIVALGVVTSVDDPEKIGRVRVKLPTYNDVETEWMGVLCNAAGPEKGLIMLPDVGDKVLILFPREDPAEGIVLGGLYGIQGPPDSGVEGSSVRRYTLLTEGGQKIILDDTRRSIHLEDKTGSSVDLSPNKFKLHAAVNLEIEAPGKSVVIRGQSIDFERG
jgi:phage baseplate assembly protein gpV/phage protein D